MKTFADQVGSSVVEAVSKYVESRWLSASITDRFYCNSNCENGLFDALVAHGFFSLTFSSAMRRWSFTSSANLALLWSPWNLPVAFTARHCLNCVLGGLAFLLDGLELLRVGALMAPIKLQPGSILPLTVACYCLMTSLCHTMLTALWSRFCPSAASLIMPLHKFQQLTIWSRIISLCSSPYPQCSARLYKVVMKFSAVSPASCLWLLNLVRSSWHFDVWWNENWNSFVQSHTSPGPARSTRTIVGHHHPLDHPWCKLVCWFGSPPVWKRALTLVGICSLPDCLSLITCITRTDQ